MGIEDTPEDDLARGDIGEVKEATSFVLEPPAPDEASFLRVRLKKMVEPEANLPSRFEFEGEIT